MQSRIHENSPETLSWILLGLAAVPALLLLQACAQTESPGRAAKKGGGGGAAVHVAVAPAVQRDVPIDIQVVGNVEAYRTVSVKSQVSGEVTRVFFREGDFVRKGDRLFAIDSRSYQAQLNQAQANLAKDQAVLAQIEANLARDQAQEKYARATAARYASLLERKLISKEMAEQAEASAEAISAAVRADLAAIRSAQASMEATKAAVENATILLGYTAIRSPIDGRTGNLDVKEGNVVTPNTTLMTINEVEPVYVTFSVPEARLKEIRKSQTVLAASQDDPQNRQTGEVTFIDNAVDATTGTIRVKGLFRNTGRRLWPGQFVRVSLRLSTRPALLVPSQAVQTGQDGQYVFVVKEDDTVESRTVLPGPRVEDDLIVESGLKPGEIVVTEGQLRLATGSRIHRSQPPAN